MKFKGKLWGLDFDATEANSPVELFQIIAPNEKDRSDVRGWVLVKSALRPYWLEIMLDDSTIFHIVSANDQLVLDEDSHVSVEFRRKPCNSPNTSPSKGDIGESVGECHTLSTLETFSSDAKDQSIDFRNSIDPFTRSYFAEIETHLVLNFPSHDSAGVDAIFVDKESFEEYVQLSEKEGKNFDQLTLSNVELCDGSVQDLHLTWEIWVSSVLPASKVLRGCYHRVNVAEKVREGKLNRIKENESLWARVTFWIDDFSDSEALERLEMISDDPDVPPYISPFYFRKEEAFLLGRLDGISSVSLGDVLRAKSSKSTCAALDLKPFLEEVFRLDPGFHRAGFPDQERSLGHQASTSTAGEQTVRCQESSAYIWRFWDPLVSEYVRGFNRVVTFFSKSHVLTSLNGHEIITGSSCLPLSLFDLKSMILFHLAARRLAFRCTPCAKFDF